MLNISAGHSTLVYFFAPPRKKLMKYSMKLLSMPMQYNIITVKN